MEWEEGLPIFNPLRNKSSNATTFVRATSSNNRTHEISS